MDHSHHHGHGQFEEMTMDQRCSMYMLWNTNVINTCIVFRQWHIHSNFQFFLSFLAIVALGCSYEWLRDLQRRVDRKIAAQLLNSGKGKNADQSLPVPLTSRLLRAGLYGASVFVSFFLMLVFMTYNAYLILATVLGASLGHYLYGGRMDPDAVLGGAIANKGMACH
ncbi:Ctr-domain-containing protein [Serendipita vermifera]|nr:Ctr-domain-containing protein [Serendipita vermifera]